jgi:hypothetical protein
LASGGWGNLLSAIKTADKYVSLDLSACAMTGNTEFDLYLNGDNGERIVSLVLPNAAQSIAAEGAITGKFPALKSVSASAVKTVGVYAFYDCDALTSVSFPAATSIGYNAFSGCAALKSVNLPAATTIGNSAFNYCSALTSVSLPAATTIGNSAFYKCVDLSSVSLPAATTIGGSAFEDCTALTSVSLQKATTIDEFAFSGCTALTSVTLGSTAPTTLGTNIFYEINTAKTVTVKVPSGATGYDTVPASYSGIDAYVKWGNGFRGGGWNGLTFVDISKINTNITLNIEN